jgi:hypothetical protein
VLDRRTAEVELLRKKYSKVDAGAQCEWVIVHSVPLGPGWNRAETDVLLILTGAYPETAPDNFYVPAGLRLQGGAVPGSMTPGSFSHQGQMWDTFSWHIDNGWSPSSDVKGGSNLLGVMREVERRLCEAN